MTDKEYQINCLELISDLNNHSDATMQQSDTSRNDPIKYLNDLLKGLDSDFYPELDLTQMEQILQKDRQWLLSRGIMWSMKEEKS